MIDLDLFEAGPFPAEKNVVDPAKAGDHWERDRAALFFKGRSNRDLTSKRFEEDFEYDYSSVHHLLTDEAFAFFLPGLMSLVLSERENESVALLGDSLVNTFLRMANGEMDRRLSFILHTYSRPQVSMIASFLEQIAQIDPYPISKNDPALNALHRFWGRYSPART